MTSRALNAQGHTVAAPSVASLDEALDLAYRWNVDEDRPGMLVSSVEMAGAVYPVAVQEGLF